MQHSELNHNGWRRADLADLVPMTQTAPSRQLARLNLTGLVRKVGYTDCCGLAAFFRTQGAVARQFGQARRGKHFEQAAHRVVAREDGFEDGFEVGIMQICRGFD